MMRPVMWLLGWTVISFAGLMHLPLESARAVQNQVTQNQVTQGNNACLPTESRFDEPAPVYPLRSSVGKGHVLMGTVRASPNCTPLPGARVVFWLANPQGEYDETSNGTVITDAQGRYRIESTYPGDTGTDRHIHIAVTTNGFRTVNTVYFPKAGQTEGVFDLVLAPLR